MRLLLIGIVAAFAASVATGDEAVLDHRIVVEGQAETSMAPDVVRIRLVADQRAASLLQAQRAAKAAADAALVLVRAEGIAESDIDTSDFVFNPRYEEPSDRGRIEKLLGYRVRQTIRVTMRDPSHVSPLLARIAESGSVAVAGVEPRAERNRQQRDEVRLLAVRAAREKAQAIVAELGQELGRATLIEVDGASFGSYGWRQAPTSNEFLVEREDGTAHNLGRITITARVKVAFELK